MHYRRRLLVFGTKESVMNKLIEQARSKAGYRSNDALAQAMLRHRPELASSLQARSLGARIGKLARGEIDWWRKNPVCLDALRLGA